MGSQLLRNQSDEQLQNCFASPSSSSSLCSETQRGCSKAQNCLFKILRIISTVPPPNNTAPTTPPSFSSDKSNGFAIDLNTGFNVTESGSPFNGSLADEKSSVAAESDGVVTVDVGKCEKVEEEKSCKSDSSVVQESTENEEILESFQLENYGVSKTSDSKEQGFMGLLIEAATLIFGDFENEISKPECETKSFKSEESKMDEDDDYVAVKKQVKRRNYEFTEEALEDKSSYPVVRSKRGRIQVLPNKYRDSILEPLTPFSRIRSTIVPNKRRSK